METTAATGAELDISTRYSKIAIPALHISGWYDTYLEGSIAGYLALRKQAATAFARRHQYLLAGPWVHIPWGDRLGDQNLGPAANLDTDAHLLRWFNHWLKDSEEFDDEPAVRHFALGSNQWHVTNEWPEEAAYGLYLHSAGNANSRKGDGGLSDQMPDADELRDVFVYDPEVPVYAPGGPQSLSGPFDQASVEMGNNLLVYTAQPLKEPVHVFGRPRVKLYAATSADSADFVAKLIRVTAAGRAGFVCIGIARSSWLFQQSGYKADVVQCWEFTLEPTSIVFGAGDAVRLEIASSAFPLYDRNSSSEMSPELAGPWTWKRSTQQIAHSLEYPSALYLPVIRGGKV